MTNKIIEAAHLAGIEFQQHQGITGRVRTTTCGSQPIEKLARFYALAYRQGLEDARTLVQANANACEPGSMLQTYLASNATAIGALKEKDHG